jgi:uncharacterized membrane protein YdjX (TVP38/TMEM64 family)
VDLSPFWTYCLGSLWVFCLAMFVDGATFSFATTLLIILYAPHHGPWKLALAGGLASALGSAVQFHVLKLMLDSGHRWLHRFAPSREKLSAALDRNPSTSFLTILVARATPLPDAPVKLVAAAGRYPLRLYALAVLLGALPYYFVLAFLARRAADLAREFRLPWWAVVAAFALVGLGLGLDRLRRRRKETP